MKTKVGHSNNSRAESKRKLESIASKGAEIALTEGLLQTYEALPDDKRDHDYERHLRAKLRAKKNQLIAMAPI